MAFGFILQRNVNSYLNFYYLFIAVHPEIGGVLIKEPNFFSFPFVFKIDPQSYSSIFEPVPNGKYFMKLDII